MNVKPQLRVHLNPTRSIFEFTRFSRAPRNLIGYSVRDALTAQDPMHRSRKPWNTEAVAVTDPRVTVSLTVGITEITDADLCSRITSGRRTVIRVAGRSEREEIIA